MRLQKSNQRNLCSDKLGGFIMGCKASAKFESLGQLLFGLAEKHKASVAKIKPGLPIFLFDYDSRELHGVFEAEGRGGYLLNKNSFMNGRKGDSPFPSQVQVKHLSKCEPLTESDFKPVIKDNYFNDYHFWYELDTKQTEKLCRLFTPTPTSA